MRSIEIIKIEKQNLLKTILIDIAWNKIDLIKQLLARLLLGQTFENITILDGCGGNGKSLLLELLPDTLRGYGHSIDINNLLNTGQSSGPNYEIAQIHNKLLIVASDPPEGAKFNTSLAKRLTGWKKFSSRKIFFNQPQINLSKLTLVDSNHKLIFQYEINNALLRRLIDYEFSNVLTENETKKTKTSTDREYKRLNEYYKCQELKMLIKYLRCIYYLICLKIITVKL